MEIANIGNGLLELFNTFLGSFDPSHNALQFALLFLFVIGSTTTIFRILKGD